MSVPDEVRKSLRVAVGEALDPLLDPDECIDASAIAVDVMLSYLEQVGTMGDLVGSGDEPVFWFKP